MLLLVITTLIEFKFLIQKEISFQHLDLLVTEMDSLIIQEGFMLIQMIISLFVILIIIEFKYLIQKEISFPHLDLMEMEMVNLMFHMI